LWGEGKNYTSPGTGNWWIPWRKSGKLLLMRLRKTHVQAIGRQASLIGRRKIKKRRGLREEGENLAWGLGRTKAAEKLNIGNQLQCGTHPGPVEKPKQNWTKKRLGKQKEKEAFWAEGRETTTYGKER